MLVQLTWTPSNNTPETFTADIPERLLHQMRELLGTPQWVASDAAMWIPCRTLPNQPLIKRLFRLARITGLDPLTPTGDDHA